MTATPAALGGAPRFDPPLPFARPARPPIEDFVRRLEPSYERGMLTNGALVAELEEQVAGLLGVDHVVAVSSCTAGLMLTLQAVLADRPGPVVVPSFTFAASAHAVAWNGHDPRFVESDPRTFQIDLTHAAQAVDGAAAILATHVFGAPCDPVAVQQVAGDAGVPVVFDAAHGLGGHAGGIPLGRFGDAEVFSLSPTKVVVAGEGGIVTTGDAELAARLRVGRDYGNPGDYDMRFVGLNARMSELHAALALASLGMLDETLVRRRELARRYQDGLAAVPGVRCQEIAPDDGSTFKDFTVAVDADRLGLDRDQLVEVLAGEGIDTRAYFDPPVHRHRAYAGGEVPDLPVTDATSASVVSLPIYPALADADVDRVVDAVTAAAAHAEALVAELARPGRVPARRQASLSRPG